MPTYTPYTGFRKSLVSRNGIQKFVQAEDKVFKGLSVRTVTFSNTYVFYRMHMQVKEPAHRRGEKHLSTLPVEGGTYITTCSCRGVELVRQGCIGIF